MGNRTERLLAIRNIISSQKVSSQEAKKQTIEWFSKVKLPAPEKIFYRYPHQLSGGQKQRVMIAMGLSCNPKMLIADEPTTALDPETRDRFYTLLQTLNKEEGTTVILVTHDTWSIGKYATRFLYLDKKVVFDGTFEEFCRSPEMTAFFGEHVQHQICHRH